MAIVRGYILRGAPEPPAFYLEYCMANCDWGGIKYSPKTAEQKAKALEMFISSRKWKRPLDEYQEKIFAQQIK